jgi:type IV secretion system protein VirB5
MSQPSIQTVAPADSLEGTAEYPAKSGMPAESSPYLAARREWDERYGSLITRARNWRFAALFALAVALVATSGLIVLSTKAKVIPYVVAIDNLGRVLAAGPADQASRADDRLKRAALFQWVSDLRTVTTDGVAQRKAIDRVYSMIANGSPAQVEIGEFYRSDPPYQRAQTKTVDVDVKAVFAASDKTYQVEWTETNRGLSGQVESEDRWKGSFTIAVSPPTDEKLIRVNPLGIYVTNVSWSKVL